MRSLTDLKAMYKGMLSDGVGEKDITAFIETVLYHCFTMALKNNCKLQDLILTDKGEFIVI